jgi:hypothetical protein
MGERSFFRTEDMALEALYLGVDDPSVDAGFRPPARPAGS